MMAEIHGRRRGQKQRHGRKQQFPRKPSVTNQPANEDLLIIRRLDRAKRNVRLLNKVALCVATLCVGTRIYNKVFARRHYTVFGEALQRSNGDNSIGRALGDSRPGPAFGHHRVPKDLMQAFGSYPNLLNVTARMRSAFHPVVKIPRRKKSKKEVGDGACVELESKRRSFWLWQKRNDIERPANENDLACDALGRKMYETYDYIVKDYTGKNEDDTKVLLEGGRTVPQLLKTREEALLYAKLPKRSRQFDVGRYDEDRRGMYTSSLFGRDNYLRTVHVGIDIGGPVGTAVYAFEDGIVHSAGYNPDVGDYGHVIVIEHILKNRHELSKVYALYGHLSAKSIQGKRPGQKIKRGQRIGSMGNTAENGGWTGTHLHFQLALNPPSTHDMPGVVSIADRSEALLEYTDPRYVLGELY